MHLTSDYDKQKNCRFALNLLTKDAFFATGSKLYNDTEEQQKDFGTYAIACAVIATN